MAAVHTVVLDERVAPELVGEVTEKLAYASDRARSAKLTDDGGGVEVVVADAADVAEVAARVREVVSALIRGYREIPKEILWRHPVTPRHQAPIAKVSSRKPTRSSNRTEAMKPCSTSRSSSPGAVAIPIDSRMYARSCCLTSDSLTACMTH